MKLSFLLSIALGIVTVVAASTLWYLLDELGVFVALSGPISEFTSPEVQLVDYTGLGRVIGVAVVLSVANVVLLTALSTLAAFLYNICTTLVGGLQVTLADDS